MEGTPNHHIGQGTACRRFFLNAMLELLWLEDEFEARSEQTRADSGNVSPALGKRPRRLALS
jgi:hypothetical protein